MYVLDLPPTIRESADYVLEGVGCQPTDLDVSPGAFKQLADPALGRVEVTWAWLPPVPSSVP